MLIYLDTCCLQRPLDDRSQPRINIEAEAILTILGIVEKKYISLANSDALKYEVSRVPDEGRRNNILETLNISSKYIELNNEIEFQANYYLERGIKSMDALHLASAVYSNVDYFCTVDDKFLKKAKENNTNHTIAISPLELIMEISK